MFRSPHTVCPPSPSIARLGPSGRPQSSAEGSVCGTASPSAGTAVATGKDGSGAGVRYGGGSASLQDLIRTNSLTELGLSAHSLSDLSADDNPLVWLSHGFTRLNGYSREDAVGQTPVRSQERLSLHIAPMRAHRRGP